MNIFIYKTIVADFNKDNYGHGLLKFSQKIDLL